MTVNRLYPLGEDQTKHEYLSTSSSSASSTSSTSAVAATESSLVVDTLSDVVDASDGVLSLREAVTEANAREGLDTITFADGIRGGTIELNMGDSAGALVVNDDLVVDGGSSGAGSMSITSSDDHHSIFDFAGASGRIEDVSLGDGSFYGIPLVKSTDSTISLERVALEATREYSQGVLADGGAVEIADSTIRVSGYGPKAVNTFGNTAITITDSDIRAVGESARAIDGAGSITVSGSTIEAGGNYGSYGIVFNGTVIVENSTIVAVTGNALDGHALAADRGILLRAGSEALVDHVTVIGPDVPVDPNFDETSSAGIEVEAGATLVLQDSLVVGDGDFVSVKGSFDDAGGNVLSSRDGVTIADVFATGQLADNGGSTRTIALLDDPSNPAIGAAIPADGVDADQRGLVRDDDPDAGAFEAGASEPASSTLPSLVEGLPIDAGDINGVARGQFVIGDAGDAVLTFMDEFAAFQSVLGVYLVGDDGEITDPRIVFERIEQSEASDLASAGARPGGGPLSTGDDVPLGLLYDAGELQPGTEFGLFLVADGADLNDPSLFAEGTLEFRNGDGSPATLDSTIPELVHTAADGSETIVLGDIMHMTDGDTADGLANALNPGGGTQVVSGILDGETVIGIEDKATGSTDADYNDVILAIDTSLGLDTLVTQGDLAII